MNRLSILFIGIQLLTLPSIAAQSKEETEILNLSDQIFKWEMNENIDALENVFHNRFTVVGSNGNSQSKEEYLSLLRSGNFVHNSIDTEENRATIADNTATVIGKGTFVVTVSGEKKKIHLSFIEVFTRPNQENPWKVLAMHASKIEE